MKTKVISGLVLALFLVTLLNVTPAFAPPPSGMISFWKLDDGTGTTAADSVGSNPGTVINAPAPGWTTGVVDGALSFDGVNDYVEVPHSSGLDITDNLSVEFWFNTNTIDRDGLVSKYWNTHQHLWTWIPRMQPRPTLHGRIKVSRVIDYPRWSGWPNTCHPLPQPHIII